MSTSRTRMKPFDRMLKEERDYWVARLSRELGDSNLPLDHPRPASYNAQTDTVRFDLRGEAREQLSRLTGDSPFLIYTTLMAALKICLHKYTGSAAVIVGSPARQTQDGGGTGPAGNALAIVDEIAAAMSFRECLQRVRETLLEAYARQSYPYRRLLEDLHLAWEHRRCMLFDVALVLEGLHDPLPDVHNDITVRFAAGEEGLDGTVEFRSSLFEKASIERFVQHYRQVVEAVLENVSVSVGDVEMITPAERQRLLYEWNDTAAGVAGAECVHELFEAQAERTPEAVAVAFEDERLTYAEVNRRANQVARHLRNIGVGPEVRVGLLMESSPEMVLALLGVLKAGGVYVPLDTSYPRERLDYMMEDAGVGLVVAARSAPAVSGAGKARVIDFDAERESIEREQESNLRNEATAQNLAYIIYTSGSTGRPKGVMISHGGLCNLAQAQARAFRLKAESRVLQFASLSFDASVSELFTTLITGAQLHLSRRGAFSPESLVELLRARSITTVTLPPSVMSVVNGDELPALETVISAGEKCPAEVARSWSRGRTFLNAYGPTEATVCATLTVWDGEQPGDPPIGRPIENVKVYVLDGRMRPVAIGIEGELYVGGAGVARGYVGKAVQTAEHFVPNPFGREPGERLYRTGDRVRYRPDGGLEYIGRADHQVKVRGYRIELGEIEATLRGHSLVRDAVVVARAQTGDAAQPVGEADRRLVAYVVTAHGEPLGADDLRSYAQQKLPDYMVPSSFVTLAKLPLTPNGKVDRQALPAPEQSRPVLAKAFVGPRNADEALLAGIWSEVLGVGGIGVNDDFFDLGGHSLLATQIVSRVREEFDVEIPVGTVFEVPTVASLTREIERIRSENPSRASSAEQITPRGNRSIEEQLAELNGLSVEEIKALLDE